MNPNPDNAEMPAPRPPYPPPGYVAASPHQKTPLLAALFSGIMPGLGQLYCGLYGRAALVFVVYVALFSSAIGSKGPELGFLVPTMVFTWFFGIFDAYRQATFLNWGLSQADAPAVGNTKAENGLMIGVALLAIGGYGALRQYFDFDLSFLIDHWYLIAMAIGGYFIVQAMRGRQEEAATPET